jgi:hypothetical protein
MKSFHKALLVVSCGFVSVLALFTVRQLVIRNNHDLPILPLNSEKKHPDHHDDAERGARNRQAYYFDLLHDPASGEIPFDIREKELEYAKTLPTVEGVYKERLSQTSNVLRWTEAGPNDVGGRTRALVPDRRNNGVVIAAGVSGGIWRSTNSGSSWTKRTGRDGNLSITSLAQHPASPDTWYASMGEYSGNSASDRGFRASYYGSGLYKSTDNGLTWTFLLKAPVAFPANWTTGFHFTSKIAVSPHDGGLYLASNALGLSVSMDGGNTFSPVLGNRANDHRWTDFDFSSDGKLAVALSSGTNVIPALAPGIYVRMHNETTFTSISPAIGSPSKLQRTLVAFAPSNPNILYVLINGGFKNDNEDDIRFFKLTYTPGNRTWTTENRTAGLPFFGGRTGYLNAQDDYNMVLAVKPDDEDFVLIGLTNLYRSRTGFASQSPNSDAGKREAWIGGYTNTANTAALYPNHHPDQHVLAFDPGNPNRLWSGHDGGISYTSDITAAPVIWSSKNNGYNVTQFYTVALPVGNSNAIAGGTQDNGTPYFTFNGNTSSSSQDITGGDGSYVHISSKYIYASSQNGNVYQYTFSTAGWSDNLKPASATDQLFIHPFAVNPRNENVMVYPSGRNIFLNEALDATDKTTGWSTVSNTPDKQLPSGFRYTTLAFSQTSAIVYLAAYQRDSVPRFVTLNTATRSVDIRRIPGVTTGSYPHRIAINPVNDKEILLLFSNYNIPSVFHSSNGGTTFSDVEGNLTGTVPLPGPSFRTGAIVRRTDGNTEYYVGTSTGLYSTTRLDGSSTQWIREGSSTIGTAVVEDMAVRAADGRVAVATHGRGIFTGNINVSERDETLPFAFAGAFPNPSITSTRFVVDIPAATEVSLEIFDMAGRRIAQPILNRSYQAGRFEIQHSVSGYASGVYLARLSSKQGITIQKFTVVR